VTGRVRLPADTELADKLAFGLTARQLTMLAAGGLSGYAIFSLAKSALPLPVAVALAAPVAVSAALLAFGRRHGLPGDLYALAAGRFLARPKLRLLAPEGIPAPLPGAPRRRPLAALDLPVRSVLCSGLVELADGGHCALLRASAASFALRSDDEQQALVEAFGRFLNGLADPVEIAVRSEPVNLSHWAKRLLAAVPASVNESVKSAAAAHARFVGELGEQAEVRRREIVLVLKTNERDRANAKNTLERRRSEAIDLLQTAGVDLQPLDGPQTVALLARTLDPPGPPHGASPTGVVHGC
jgi:PrgI family protein